MSFRIAEKWIDLVVNLFFPRTCPVCGEIISEKSRLACSSCYSKVEFVKPPTCAKCGKQITSREREYCFDCEKHTHSFDQGWSLLNYTKAIKDSIARYKYHNKREYSDWYAEELLKKYRGRILAVKPDVLIPVPLHKSRKRFRGFNQAEVLCRNISKGTGIPMRTDILLRKRKTAPQKQLSGKQRSKNLEHAFYIEEFDSKIENVILIDDIYTTGSTVEACSKMLKKAGVKKVFVLTIAIGKGY